MEVQELKKLIKNDNIPNFLIFTGDEWKIQQEYIKQIAKVKKLSISYAEDIDVVWNELKAQSLFGSDVLYVLRDDKELMTNEKIYSRLNDVLRNNMLILELTSVDKRLKILKTYKTSTFEFEALNEAVLKRYIQKEIDLNDRNCEILMEICGYSYGHCLLEIDKIKRYVNYLGPAPTQDGVFQKLLEDGTIYVPPRDTLWEFIKAFLQNKPKLAYELYQDLKELETPTLSIISNLYNNAKQVLQVQTCTSKDISKSTGLISWQIRNAKECINRFSTRDLEVLLRWLQRIERDIKTGLLDEKIAIDYLFSVYF